MHTSHDEKERGQSIVIIAFIVVILLALVAVVVDVGNAYAERRVVQNAVDAATMAGVRQLAEHRTGIPGNQTFVLRIQVLNAVEDYAEENGLNRDDVQAWFINTAGERIAAVEALFIPVPDGAQGVEVVGDLPFETYFAHLIGFRTMTASAQAKGWVLKGPCDGEELFPLTLNIRRFYTQTGQIPAMGTVYTMFDHGDPLAPGNWGFLYWSDPDGLRGTPPQGPQVPVLEDNIDDTTRSGHWAAGDWVHGNPGVNMQPVLDELEDRINNTRPATVTIPIYDSVQGTGNNTYFRIAAFGAFRLTCAFNSSNHYVEAHPGDCAPCLADGSDAKCIRGYFVRIVEPRFTDGCLNTGVTAPSFRQPRPTPTPLP